MGRWLLPLVAAAACGEGPAAEPDAGAQPDAPARTAPEIRSLYVALDDHASSLLDLTHGSRSRVLPQPVAATFRVFAADAETATDALEVTLVDADGAPPPGQQATLRNGIWEVGTEVGPGSSWRVRVRDADGDEVIGPHELALPSHQEAISGIWKLRSYGTDQAIASAWTATWTSSGTWLEDRPTAEGGPIGGDFDLADGELTLRRTWGEEDTNPDTIELTTRTVYYLDDTYFDTGPYARTGTGTGLAGTWTRSRQVAAAGAAARAISETLELDAEAFTDPERPEITWAGSWQETRVETETGGSDVTTTRSGRYRLVSAQDYNASLGNFLHRETTQLDGAPLETPLTDFEVQVVRLDRLLLSPRVR